jgi:hypothetical protein
LDASAVFPALRGVPDGPAEGSAYRQVASGLRQAIAAGRYPAGQRLPTEAELVSATGLSRQTVRRAFQELVTDGAIYRVRGRGTFAVPGDGKYLRSFGSVDDLMALSLDTEMQVVEPLHVLASLESADRLQVEDDLVMTMSFLRLHEGAPFCYTRVHVPMELGRRLRDLPELAGLAEPGACARVTVISLLERVSDHPIHGALRPRSPGGSAAQRACRCCGSTGCTGTGNCARWNSRSTTSIPAATPTGSSCAGSVRPDRSRARGERRPAAARAGSGGTARPGRPALAR